LLLKDPRAAEDELDKKYRKTICERGGVNLARPCIKAQAE
jgi:hypothetical protein